MGQQPTKLTDYELESMLAQFNFSAGHARYEHQQAACQAFGEVNHYITSSGDKGQQHLERDFVDAFFELAEQRAYIPRERMLFCGSASMSIEIVANYLRMNKLSVALIEPAFDNLADILRRHGVPLAPLSEFSLSPSRLANTLNTVESNAIFLVVPNNPTGFLHSKADFELLVDYCVRQNKLLILDFCCRFFSPELLQWDQYKLLENSGVRYVAIEDTGKTWPTEELKVSTLLADRESFTQLQSIYTDIFLHLSPINFIYVTAYIRTSLKQGLARAVWQLPMTNRAMLRDTISSLPMSAHSSEQIGVEWIRIDHVIDDIALVSMLAAQGIRVVPGRFFFWSNPNEHTNFFRVALMRDSKIFAEGMRLFEKILAHGLRSVDEASRADCVG